MRKTPLPRKWLTCETIALTIILALTIASWQPVQAQRSRRGARTTKVSTTKHKAINGNNYDETKAVSLIDNFVNSSKSDSPQPDITPIRNYYNGLNNAGKQQMLTHLTDKTTQLLEGNNKTDALAHTRLYSALAPSNDEKLPTMLYIQGTIYAESLDKNQLQQTISELEKCKTTPQTEELLSRLRKNMNDVINYKPVLERMGGTSWIASKIEFNYKLESLNYGYDLSPSLVVESGYDYKDKTNVFSIECDASPFAIGLNMDNSWSRTQFLYPIGVDSIYAVWCSERISGDQAIVFAPILRGVASKVAAETNAEYSQRKKHSFGTEIAVSTLTTVGEMLFNALIDAIFTPSTKLYTIEAFLKYENDYTLTGSIRYQYAKIDVNGKVKDRESAIGGVTFSRLTPESGIAIEDCHDRKYDGCSLMYNKIGVTSFLSSENTTKFREDMEKAFETKTKIKINNAHLSEDSIKYNRIWLQLEDSLLNTLNYFNGARAARYVFLPPFDAKYSNMTDKLAKKLYLESNKGVYINKYDDLSLFSYFLKQNDVVVAINGQKVSNTNDFETIMAKFVIGDLITCSVIRNGNYMDIPIWVTWNSINPIRNRVSAEANNYSDRYTYWKKNGTKKNRESWNDDQYKWLVLYNDSVLASHGVKSHLLDNVTPDVGLKVVGIPDKVKKKVKMENGAFVEDVELIGAANVAGIKQKDIIIAINGMTIDTGEDFYYVVRSAKPGDWLNCSILRNNKQIMIPIRVTWK